MMNIVGIDLSLTSTGIAIIRDNEITTRRVTSNGKAGATLQERIRRLRNLASDIQGVCEWAGPDMILIEGPAYSRSNPGMHDRSGLWWLLVDALDLVVSLGYPIVEVSPSCRSRYATGRGNAKKDDVLSAVVRRYPGVDVNGNDEADALVLAAMGARRLSYPVEASLPAANLKAMDGVHWDDATWDEPDPSDDEYDDDEEPDRPVQDVHLPGFVQSPLYREAEASVALDHGDIQTFTVEGAHTGRAPEAS